MNYRLKEIAFAITIIALLATGARSQCGSENIQTKDLADADTTFLALAPVHTTVYAEGLLPVTAPRQLITLTATIVGYKLEDDGDIHICLQDGKAKMIAEMPSPECPEVKYSSRYVEMATCRAWFLAHVGQPGAKMKKANVQVTITGQRFMDLLHGQAGAAPNGVEAHPLLSIQ